MAGVVCVYEVVVKCHPEVYDAYLGRIKAYVSTRMENAGFQRAVVTQLEPDANGWKQIMLEYDITDKAKLQHYFDNDAAKVAEDEKATFGDKCGLVRRQTRDILYTASK